MVTVLALAIRANPPFFIWLIDCRTVFSSWMVAPLSCKSLMIWHFSSRVRISIGNGSNADPPPKSNRIFSEHFPRTRWKALQGVCGSRRDWGERVDVSQVRDEIFLRGIKYFLSHASRLELLQTRSCLSIIHSNEKDEEKISSRLGDITRHNLLESSFVSFMVCVLITQIKRRKREREREKMGGKKIFPVV